MNFERNSQLSGKHAILSPSQSSWLRYTSEEELISRIKAYYAAPIGTALHEIASDLIGKRLKINKHDKKLVLFELLKKKIPRRVIDMDIWYDAFMTFVNDAIDYDMFSEIPLDYTDVAFGHTDAISFDERTKKLRIHDLKTGVKEAKIDQLIVYAALFCLKNKIKPMDISIELRIYQSSDIMTMVPDPEEVMQVINIIIDENKFITGYLREEG